MPRFRVDWAQAAYRDLEEIASRIAQESASVAERWLEKLKGRASTLESFPQRGRLVPELARWGIRSYREILVKPYRVIYRISGKTVFVLGVFDGRRDLSEVVLFRLLRG